MNTKFSSIVLFFFVLNFTLNAQNIWRVNNNPGIDADFTTLQSAMNSSSVQSGDIILLEQSSIEYTVSTITKAVTIIGSGYLKNQNPGLDYTENNSVINLTVAINTQSSGSKFYGIHFKGQVSFNAVANSNVNDVLFQNCIFDNSIYMGYSHSTSNYNNITFRKNYFNQKSITLRYANWYNFVFENNIVHLTNSVYYFSGLKGNGNIFRNNTFTSPNNNGLTNIEVVNAYIANNIFDFDRANLVHVFTNSVVKNNLFNNTPTLPNTASNNIFNVDPATLFVNTGSDDSRFRLAENSPAKGAGVTVGNVVSPDCGAFGGTDPYVLSGIGNIPTIYELNVPTSVPQGQTSLNVMFSTRSNN